MGANIPLPALDTRTQFPNPLDEYMRAVQLKGAQQEQQLRAGQIQQQQYELQDQATLRSLAPKFVQKDAQGNVTGYDHDGLINAATQSGVNPRTLMQMEMQRADMRDKLAQASSHELDAHDKANDQLFQLLEGVRSAAKQSPEQAQSAWQNALPRAQKLGADPSSLPAQFPSQNSDAFVDQIESSLALHKQIIADARTQQETKKNVAQTAEAEAGTEQKKAETRKAQAETERTKIQTEALRQFGGMTPEMIEAKYLTEMQKPVAQRDTKFTGAYEHMKQLIPVANFNLQNSGAAVDAGGNPSQIALAIANNQMKWSEAVSPRTPQSVKNAIMTQVFKLNPSYDTAEFGLETDSAKKARSGAWADTRLAYNTALDHADQLQKAAEALNNHDVKGLNSLKNFFKTEFGSPDVPTFDAIANAYNHEVTSVVSKGHITDAEVKTGGAVMPDNASPDQIKGVTTAFKNLMTSKRDELDKIIKGGAGSKANKILGVTSGSEGGGGGKVSPGGKAPRNPDGTINWNAYDK